MKSTPKDSRKCAYSLKSLPGGLPVNKVIFPSRCTTKKRKSDNPVIAIIIFFNTEEILTMFNEFMITNYTKPELSIKSHKSLTWVAETSNSFFSISVNSISIIFSTPFEDRITGKPIN